MSTNLLSTSENLTAMLNGKEPFPSEFKEVIDLNILETHSAIRLETLNPYSLELLSQGIDYMARLIPNWKQRASPLDGQHLIISLLSTIANQSEHIGKINNQSPVEWYYGLCMLIKLQMEFLKTRTDATTLRNEYKSKPILDEQERALFDKYEDKVAQTWAAQLNLPSGYMHMLQTKKLNLKEETSAMQYLIGINDFKEIEEKRGFLTPAQANHNGFMLTNFQQTLKSSATSDASLFILDNSQIKNFIEQKSLSNIVDSLLNDEIRAAYNTANLIHGDDVYAVKASLRTHLSTPDIDTSEPSIEF